MVEKRYRKIRDWNRERRSALGTIEGNPFPTRSSVTRQTQLKQVLLLSLQETAEMKMLMAVLLIGSVASSQALFFDLFKKEAQQPDPWTVDPWVQQPADPWVQQKPADSWSIPSFQPVIKEVPIYIPYPKFEPTKIVKPFPIFKPEFVKAPIPIFKPQLTLPNFNFKPSTPQTQYYYQPQYYHQVQQYQQQQQQQQQQAHHQHQTTTPSSTYEAPDAHH